MSSDGIRFRGDKGSSAPSEAKDGGIIDRKEASRIEKLITEAAGKSPPWLAKVLIPLAPVLGIVGAVAEFLLPYVVMYSKMIYKVWCALPTNMVGLIYGLGLCFFGGFFPVTIAAYEAFAATGGQKVKACLTDLADDVQACLEANKADNKKDDDGDGVADVDQIDSKDLLARKTGLILRTVNPERITGAVAGLYQGYAGVLVVLKFQFARTIALAVSIGDTMRPLAEKVLSPAMAAVMPKAYHQWIGPLINYLCKWVAMTVAWWIQRFISTVQSAIKGGLMAARSAMHLLIERGFLDVHPDESYIDEVLGWCLAGLGAWFQISCAWDLPFYVDLLFTPFSISEWFLKWSVTWMENPVPQP